MKSGGCGKVKRPGFVATKSDSAFADFGGFCAVFHEKDQLGAAPRAFLTIGWFTNLIKLQARLRCRYTANSARMLPKVFNSQPFSSPQNFHRLPIKDQLSRCDRVRLLFRREFAKQHLRFRSI